MLGAGPAGCVEAARRQTATTRPAELVDEYGNCVTLVARREAFFVCLVLAVLVGVALLLWQLMPRSVLARSEPLDEVTRLSASADRDGFEVSAADVREIIGRFPEPVGVHMTSAPLVNEGRAFGRYPRYGILLSSTLFTGLPEDRAALRTVGRARTGPRP
ncbi:MAG TPA: hypothetical protein VGD43_24015 [Micromonospora sp.]